MRTFAALLIVACLTSSCASNHAALNKSANNVIWIKMVQLGQTQDEVRRIMKHPPESTSIRTLPEGTTEETWNYLTDYENDTNTTLTFRDGRVVAIDHTKWLGNGDFSQPLGKPATH